QGTVLLEAFLFDFSGDLYGEVIDVAFIDWIRPELKFDSVEDLVRRMNEDARLARGAGRGAGRLFHAVAGGGLETIRCPGRSAAPQGRLRPSSRAMVVRCRHRSRVYPRSALACAQVA